MKHNKSKYKKQKVADTFHITSNCYNPLSNVLNDDNSPANTGRLSEST
jgi:hypothetical protein